MTRITMVSSLGLLLIALRECCLPMPVLAGNIVITGHDDDLHSVTDPIEKREPAKRQLAAMVLFARAGAPDPSLPVLIFDEGNQLQRALTDLNIPFQKIDLSSQVPDSRLFDVHRFSAIGVASDSSCNGCDNHETSSANLAKAKDQIAKFFNAGAGIFAFAGASNRDYYSFVPATVSSRGSPDDHGYDQTLRGRNLNIPAVNGDPTHNFFEQPGTGRVDRLFEVVELYSGHDSETNAEVSNVPATLAIRNARIASAGFTQADWMEVFMEATTVVVTFGLLAFMVERFTNGVAVVLGY